MRYKILLKGYSAEGVLEESHYCVALSFEEAQIYAKHLCKERYDAYYWEVSEIKEVK